MGPYGALANVIGKTEAGLLALGAAVVGGLSYAEIAIMLSPGCPDHELLSLVRHNHSERRRARG